MKLFIDKMQQGFVLETHLEQDNSDMNDEVMTIHMDGLPMFSMDKGTFQSVFSGWLNVKVTTKVMPSTDVLTAIREVMNEKSKL
jgi:hypothetical protein